MAEKEPANQTQAGESAVERRKLIGFPGEGQGLLAVPHYIGSKAHLNAHGPNGAPGLYSVEFVLARPNSRNMPEARIQFADAFRGDSHLAIAKPAVIVDIDPDQIQLSYQTAAASFMFRGYPNEAGFLGKIVADPFHAPNRMIAGASARTAVQGLLSNLSSQLDIPLIIEIVEVTELATKAKGVSFVAPFSPTPMAVRSAGSFHDPELEHAVALYREALNSSTSLYRFLCFYKIFELSRKRRKRLGIKEKKNLRQSRPGEQIPVRDSKAMTEWLNALFYVNRDWDEAIFDQVFIPEALGKKLNNLVDNELRPLRDRIAHGILDDGDFLLLDRQEDRDRVSHWLPLMRCMARRFMKNDFPDYLEYLGEDGSISE